MASVTFPTEYGGDGKTYTDDADPTTGLDGTGYITRFVPTLAGSVAMAAHATQKADEADQSAQSASASAQQANEDRDSINLDLQTLNGLVADAQGSADAAASSATTASNLADAVAEATATYTSVSAGLAATVDTNYFRVIAAPEATRVSVYRNDAGAATPITTYYTKTGVDAKHSAAVRLNRSLQRLGDNGQTLHSDFNLAAYGLGTPLYGGVQDAVESEELWNGFERLGGTLAYQHTADGSLKYVYVPPNVIAREYNPETGQYQAQDYGSIENTMLWSTDPSNPSWTKTGITPEVDVGQSIIEGVEVWTLRESTENGAHNLNLPRSFIAGVTYCVSYILKQAGRSRCQIQLGGVAFPGSPVADFDLQLGSVISSTDATANIKPDADGYFRISITATADADATGAVFLILQSDSGQNSYQGDGVSGVKFAHAQRVQGTTPGPVIVTEGAPVTRAADNIKRVFQEDFNGVEGTFIIECEIDASETTQTLYFLGDSDNNRIAQYYSKSDGAMLNRVVASGMPYNPPNIPVLAGKIRAGVTFKNGLAIFGANGTTVSSMPASLPNITQALLGKNSENSFYLNGAVRLVKAIPKAVSEPEFQHLVSLEVSQ